MNIEAMSVPTLWAQDDQFAFAVSEGAHIATTGDTGD